MARPRRDPEFKAAVLGLLAQVLQQPDMTRAELARLLRVSRSAVDQYFDGKSIPVVERLSAVFERFPMLEPPVFRGHRFALEAFTRPMKPREPSGEQLPLSLFEAIRSLNDDKLAVRILPRRSDSSTVTLEVQVKFGG